MAAKKKARLTKTGMELDLTGVEASERRRKKRIPEGVYRAKVREVGPAKFKSGRKGLTWELEVVDDGPGKGARFWEHNVFIDEDGSIMQEQLWTVRGILQALNPKIKIPNKLTVPYDKLAGRTCAIEVADGEDNSGNIRSEIIDIFHESLIEGDEEEEDEEDEEDEDEEDWEDEEESDEEEEESDEEEDEEEFDLEEDEL